MDAATRHLVRQRASDRCEYCGRRQEQSPLATLHVEHIVAKKHGGSDAPDNLALACVHCNLHKGSNAAGFDPETGALTGLFHPRRHVWPEHFKRVGLLILGRTPIGRVTVEVLQMNSKRQMRIRSQPDD